MKELGLSLSVAVLLDAVVVRGILLPSALTLIGRRLWWPGLTPGAEGRRTAEREMATVYPPASCPPHTVARGW